MKSMFIRFEVLAGVFVLFFMLQYFADTLVYNVSPTLAKLHGLFSGSSSIVVMFIIHFITRKKII